MATRTKAAKAATGRATAMGCAELRAPGATAAGR